VKIEGVVLSPFELKMRNMLTLAMLGSVVKLVYPLCPEMDVGDL
jgi:hypothetical protein